MSYEEKVLGFGHVPFKFKDRASSFHVAAGRGSFHVSPMDFRSLCGAGVYVLWAGKVALYVGSAKNVLARISDLAHHVIPRCLQECTEIEIKVCVSEANARATELRMIQHLRPEYNVAGRPDGPPLGSDNFQKLEKGVACL